MSTQDKAYLVQEYLHDNWHPLWFSQVATEVQRAKLNYVGSATLLDNWLIHMVGETLRAQIEPIKDPLLHEELLDCAVNQTFRRDVFIRGHHKDWPVKQREILQNTRIVLRQYPKDGFKYKTSAGEAQGNEAVYKPVYDALSSGPKTINELMQLPAPNPRSMNDTLHTVAMLLHAAHAEILHPVSQSKQIIQFNRAVARAVTEGAPYLFLASSQIGCAVTANTAEMLMLDTCFSSAQVKAETLALTLRQKLQALGRSLIKDGKTLTESSELANYTRQLADTFINTTLKNWKGIGVV